MPPRAVRKSKARATPLSVVRALLLEPPDGAADRRFEQDEATARSLTIP